MRANLARHARHLVVRHAPFAPSCTAYAAAIPRRPTTPVSLVRRQQSRRTFLNILFQKPPREIRQPEYEPGWMQIMVWRSRMLDHTRPPPRKELIAAWKSLMQSKKKNKIPLNSTQAMQCRRLLEYLTQPRSNDQNVKPLSTTDLALARQVLLDIDPIERSQEHLKLARVLHNTWLSGEFSGKPLDEAMQWSYFLRSLCRFGGAREALDNLNSKWDDAAYSKYTTGEDSLVETVAQGLAEEGLGAQLVQFLEQVEAKGVPYTQGLQETIVLFFAQKNKIPETKHWFTKPLHKGQSRVGVYQAVAGFAQRNNLEEWARPYFLELGQTQPRKKYWDTLLQAMLLMGMRLEEVKPMMAHMVTQNGPLSPDTETINSLLRASAETVNLDLAKEIFELAEDQDIRPNEETYLILLSLYISTESLVDAKVAFQKLQEAGSISPKASNAVWSEYFQTMNGYLMLLCRQQPPNFEYILQLLETVEEERIQLDPATVAALCLRFLENDQNFDVMDILSVHAFFYSEAQREVIQTSFVDFCLDPNTSTSRSWGAYQLLQQFFQDLSFERRVKLLQGFFDRKRPDMATFVFGHMRQHRNKAYQPTLDTYVQTFEGFAQNPDREGTEAVYNMLKMDTRVQPDTRLYTSIILAFAGSDCPLKALDVWSKITQSREGPSYESLQAVFWALERKAGGDKQARQLWDKIESMDLDVPSAVYAAYIGALAGNGRETEIRGLITKAASITGSEPDAMTLGIVYNALPGQQLQSNFQEWAQKRYRNQWAELKKKGRRMTDVGLCQFKLNRVLKA